jgi:hypothetical protein
MEMEEKYRSHLLGAGGSTVSRPAISTRQSYLLLVSKSSSSGSIVLFAMKDDLFVAASL